MVNYQRVDLICLLKLPFLGFPLPCLIAGFCCRSNKASCGCLSSGPLHPLVTPLSPNCLQTQDKLIVYTVNHYEVAKKIMLNHPAIQLQLILKKRLKYNLTRVFDMGMDHLKRSQNVPSIADVHPPLWAPRHIPSTTLTGVDFWVKSGYTEKIM